MRWTVRSTPNQVPISARSMAIRLAIRSTVPRGACRESTSADAPATSRLAKNAVFPIRERVITSATTMITSTSRSIALPLSSSLAVSCRKSCQLRRGRSSSCATISPMPTARLISSNPARWLRFTKLPLAWAA